MPYRIRYSAEARDAIRRAPAFFRAPIRRWIDRLTEDPRPGEAGPLEHIPDGFRIRLRAWRLVYQVREDEMSVLILRIGLKEGPEFYEGLPVDE